MIIDDTAVQHLIDLSLRKPLYSYPMYQNAPRPPIDDYAAVRLVRTSTLGKDQTDTIERGGRTFNVVTGIRVLKYQVMFSRDNEEVQEVQGSMSRPDVQRYMIDSGYAVMTCNPIDVETLTLETNWEVRSGLWLELNVLRTQEIEVDHISGLAITGEFSEGDKTITTNITV